MQLSAVERGHERVGEPVKAIERLTALFVACHVFGNDLLDSRSILFGFGIVELRLVLHDRFSSTPIIVLSRACAAPSDAETRSSEHGTNNRLSTNIKDMLKLCHFDLDRDIVVFVPDNREVLDSTLGVAVQDLTKLYHVAAERKAANKAVDDKER
jgi:hypothetical protein